MQSIPTTHGEHAKQQCSKQQFVKFYHVYPALPHAAGPFMCLAVVFRMFFQIQNARSLKNMTCKHAWLKHRFRCELPSQFSKCDPEINLKSTELQAWIPASPFLCSSVPLDRAMAPKVPKRAQRHEIMHFGYQTRQHPLPKLQLITNYMASQLHSATNDPIQITAKPFKNICVKQQDKVIKGPAAWGKAR